MERVGGAWLMDLGMTDIAFISQYSISYLYLPLMKSNLRKKGFNFGLGFLRDRVQYGSREGRFGVAAEARR